VPRAKVGFAIIAPKFCTIIGSVLDNIYSLIVEFDVYALIHEEINGRTKGIAHRAMPGL
jgi:hypothetical protein